MDKTQVIASVAGDLHATEESLDQAITRATALVQSMIGSRAALNLSAVVGAERGDGLKGLGLGIGADDGRQIESRARADHRLHQHRRAADRLIERFFRRMQVAGDAGDHLSLVHGKSPTE